jgi:hypothetical protein
MDRIVIVYQVNGQWWWRTVGSRGRVLRSSEAGFFLRDDATEAACAVNPGIPVEVDTFYSATGA